MAGKSTSNKNVSHSSDGKPVKNIRCYKCKQLGHFKNQCRSPEKEKDKQVNAFSGIFLTGEFNDKDWYVDSGASTHMISQSSKSLLKNVSYNLETRDIVVANKKTVPVICSSDIEITTRVRNKEHKVNVNNVLCIYNLTTNLSVRDIINSGNRVVT